MIVVVVMNRITGEINKNRTYPKRQLRKALDTAKRNKSAGHIVWIEERKTNDQS